MELLLDKFEHQIDGTILKRGLNYFKQGCVTDLDELGEGNYEISVEGSDTYIVNLSLKRNVVIAFDCDCPYGGMVCKHVVAALFYLRENLTSEQDLPAKKGQKQKEKSATEQAKELLDTLSHDALKAFVHNTCVNDSQFRQLFIAKHIQLLYPESKELYTKQLQALIKTYSDRHGFIDRRNAMHLGSMISQMVKEAMAGMAKGEIQKSIFIASAIIEEMLDLINYNADDSDGQIGSCIEEAITILDALTDLELNETQHRELFDYLTSLFEKETLKGWDWHFDIMALGIKLLKTNQEKERIKAILNKIKPNGKSWDWDYKKAQELMLELIKKTEGGKATTQFIENNLSNSRFRIELIEKALNAKDYTKVINLAKEGIAKDEKEAPGLASDWRNYLLTTYQQAGDVQNTIQLARYFFLHSSGRHHPLKHYYDLLKSLIPNDQWCDYVQGLTDDIKKESRSIDYNRISQLYIWETYWDKLFELLQQNVSFERIASAEQYLAGSYSNELAILYKDLILIHLKRNMGREHYQAACQYIRRMIKLGAHPMAADLIQNLKALYPTRRALLEELGKV